MTLQFQRKHIAMLASVAAILAPAAIDAVEGTKTLRRPVALANSDDGRWLYVANRDSGSISTLDVALREVTAERCVGRRLSDLAFHPSSSRLLVTDESSHEMLMLETNGDDSRLRVAQRLPVSPYPVSIAIAPGGAEATIASLWSRRLTFISLDSTARIEQVLDLPFAPRMQLFLPARNRLLVADAFAGKFVLVDVERRAIAETREIPGHNVRGLAVSPSDEMLLFSHQMLNDLAHSIRNDIHWGLLMSNDLRWLKIDSVLSGGELFYRGAHMHPLGDSGRGGGDPGAIDVGSDGTVVVALSGVNDVALGKEGDFSMQRLKVGRRPTAVRIAPDGRTAFIANTFDDSISIVDLKQRQVVDTVSLGPAPELSLAQRGELLFYDARLSHDGWMSCHSCHTDGHANGQMNDNFSDRSFGAAKRVLSLLGVKGTLPLAWNGQFESFERQIRNSLESTMQRDEPLAREETTALTAFLKTLEVPPSLDELRGTRDTAAIQRGRIVFERRDCANCHPPPTYTSAENYDVGLRDSQGVKQFNPPSLRGVSHRRTFFHDSRASTLNDVFKVHRHPNLSDYTTDEIADLTAFLRSL